MSRASPTCAAPRCAVAIERGNLFCREHWLALPVRLRRAIHTTYRARHMESYRANFREAIELIEAEERRYTDIFGNPVSPCAPVKREGEVQPRSSSSRSFIVPPFLGVAR